ncbi:hypothetical protein [Streptomyces sp. NPDC047009]|uniref:hypothetical protein n=1 Tax=Streptomyces sp. NPDC047009 TaxID=3154496 RepID=UPI0033D1D62A
MTSTETSSLVLHGKGRASARLRDGVVLLEADGVRRRIPVAAIERVDVHGARVRRLTVVLGRVFGCDQQVVRVRSLSQIIEARRWRPAR